MRARLSLSFVPLNRPARFWRASADYSIDLDNNQNAVITKNTFNDLTVSHGTNVTVALNTVDSDVNIDNVNNVTVLDNTGAPSYHSVSGAAHR